MEVYVVSEEAIESLPMDFLMLHFEDKNDVSYEVYTDKTNHYLRYNGSETFKRSKFKVEANGVELFIRNTGCYQIHITKGSYIDIISKAICNMWTDEIQQHIEDTIRDRIRTCNSIHKLDYEHFT